MLDRLKGKAKEAYGNLTHDTSKKVEGQADQARGDYETKKGEVKENVKDKIDQV
ncbi:MAG: CsbD family protein [Deltaproteobacteria bacterium]|nr:CsbD family protein [Deltaproteobacteria bacterium]